jgi:hypothetical protein
MKEPDNVLNILREYQGIQNVISNPKLQMLAPKGCFFIDGPTTERNAETWSSSKSWIAQVKNVSGRSLEHIAQAKQPNCTLRLIMSKVREILPIIHEEFGFFGGISVHSIFWDSVDKKITFTDWHRNN